MLYLARQDRIAPDTITAIVAKYRVSSWLYLGEDTNWRIRAEAVIPAGIQRIPVARHLDEAAGRLRQPYIDWIGELAKTNQSPLWWASEIAARNPYHMLFTRICLLDAAYHIIGDGFEEDVLVIAGTPALLREITAYLQKREIPWSDFVRNPRGSVAALRKSGFETAQTLASALPPVAALGKVSPLYQKFLDKHITYRQKILRKHAIPRADPLFEEKTALFFSWIDRRSFAPDGSYTDPNFGPLPALYKQRGYKVAFVPRILHTIPYEEAVARLKKTGETFFFPEQFVSHPDMQGFARTGKSFSPVLHPDQLVAGIPVTALAREHIDQTRQLIPENLLYHTLIERMHKEGTGPSVILHTCEGHSWENSLCLAVHTHMKGTKVFGYDNVTFSRFVLSMFPSKEEQAFKPLPDHLVTNGPLFQKTLIREGYPPERIRCGCALRHTYLWKERSSPRDRDSRPAGSPVRILVATAIGLGDSVELIAKAALAFGSIEPYEVIIKCHPMVSVDEVKKYLGHLPNHRNVSFSTSAIADLLPETDLLLYTYTSVCYEAMMYGVYPVCVQPENFINLDKLDATPDIRALAITKDDLIRTAEMVTSRSQEERIEWETRARTIVREALAPVDDAGVSAFFL